MYIVPRLINVTQKNNRLVSPRFFLNLFLTTIDAVQYKYDKVQSHKNRLINKYHSTRLLVEYDPNLEDVVRTYIALDVCQIVGHAYYENHSCFVSTIYNLKIQKLIQIKPFSVIQEYLHGKLRINNVNSCIIQENEYKHKNQRSFLVGCIEEFSVVSTPVLRPIIAPESK